MKIIKYNICHEANFGTEENPQMQEVLFPVTLGWNEVNEEIAKKEAYNGEYTIEDDGIKEQILAPRNILAEEYITLHGVLYKATANIPNGEPIIVGQNAIETTVEEQLYELKGE